MRDVVATLALLGVGAVVAHGALRVLTRPFQRRVR
jgi:hypothetical protein